MFESIKSSRISEYIIKQIRKTILEGRLMPGDRLPPERKLTENFGVSKSTPREPLRSLEILGFLEIKKEAGGGAFVTEGNLKKVRDCFTNDVAFARSEVMAAARTTSLGVRG